MIECKVLGKVQDLKRQVLLEVARRPQSKGHKALTLMRLEMLWTLGGAKM